MKATTIRKVFGKKRLTSADAGVIGTLSTFGPWGIMLLAAYLAGQGLANLANKVRSQAVRFAPEQWLTQDEMKNVSEAVQTIRFRQLSPELRQWIEANPPAWEGFLDTDEDMLSRVQDQCSIQEAALPPENDPDYCAKLLAYYEMLTKRLDGMTGLADQSKALKEAYQQTSQFLDAKYETVQDKLRKAGCFSQLSSEA